MGKSAHLKICLFSRLDLARDKCLGSSKEVGLYRKENYLFEETCQAFETMTAEMPLRITRFKHQKHMFLLLSFQSIFVSILITIILLWFSIFFKFLILQHVLLGRLC